MRAFVAVNLPAETRTALHDALAPIRARTRSVRWVAAEALHVTLQFLGNVEDNRAGTIAGALASPAAGASSLNLHIGGFGAFPNLRRARNWWLGVACTALVELQREVAGALVEHGFDRDTRPYHPHVTVGRAPRTIQAQDVAVLADAGPGVSFSSDVRVASIELMRSELRPDGARYTPIVSLPLGT